MSANATGSGKDTYSNAHANKTATGGEESKASNVSTAGGPNKDYGHGKLGMSGPHESRWKNIADPRVDSNNTAAQARAEAQAQARAEADREKHAELERVRAKERGDFDAERAAAAERAEAEKQAAAARARAEGQHHAERQAEQDKQLAVEQAKRNAMAEAEEQRRLEREREEAERNARKGGVRDAVKNIGRNLQGAGETIRGRVNGKVDQRFGHDEAAERHLETARRGEHQIGVGGEAR